MQIDVHPAFAPGYYTMVLDGFRSAGFSMRLTRRGFPTPDFPDFYGGQGTMALVLRARGRERRIVVAADDLADFRRGWGRWANLIAKVNVHPSADASYIDARVLPVGPLFAIRTRNLVDAANILGRKLLMPPEARDQLNWREEYRYYFRRLPETSYRPARPRPDYVFFAATSWVEHPNVASTRAEFIRACMRQPAVRFEGGFAPRSDNDESDYPGLYVSGRYRLKEYVRRTGWSTFVFNSPAVHGCLGWKLGEFLALGKAILSTPLGRLMPGAFEPEEHFVPTDGTAESFDAAIVRLVADRQRRERLEQRARQYYDEYLRPDRLVRRIVSASLDV
jgi:Glycosyl transferases group 1